MNKVKLYGQLANNFNTACSKDLEQGFAEYLYDTSNLRETISALFSQEKELKN